MRRRSHGLTLVETLVVLAIAGLIIAVLLAVLLPSDDRKVRLEAERLAAFLTAASAESVMRDAPVRVVFDLDRGTATREFTRLGADITSALWQEDENAEIFEVRNPVRLDTVDSGESPDRTSGNGYLIFRGERTEGAVVVLGVEQVFYSVVVPPNGAEIKVEKGRSGRPGGGAPIDRDLRPFADALGSGLGGDAVAGNLPVGGLGGANPLPNLNPNAGRNTSNRARGGRDNNRRDDAPPEPSSDPVSSTKPKTSPSPPKPPVTDKTPPPDPPEPQEPEPADPTDPDPNPQIGGACVTDVDCGPADGWAACNQATGTCELEPVGRALRLSDVTVKQPTDQQIKGPIESILKGQIAQGQLHLITYFDSGRVWLVQGQRAGEIETQSEDVIKQYRQVSSFPTYPGDDLPAEGYACDQEAQSCQVSFALAEDEIEIFIQQNTNPPPQTCNYQVLRLKVEVAVRVTLAPGLVVTETGPASDGAPETYIRLTAFLGTAAAREIGFNGQTLEGLLQSEMPLEQAAEDEVGDLNGDGQPDAWRFVFEGPAETVGLTQAPSEDPNARPQYCL